MNILERELELDPVDLWDEWDEPDLLSLFLAFLMVASSGFPSLSAQMEPVSLSNFSLASLHAFSEISFFSACLLLLLPVWLLLLVLLPVWLLLLLLLPVALLLLLGWLLLLPPVLL
jgi:hypothetical protein